MLVELVHFGSHRPSEGFSTNLMLPFGFRGNVQHGIDNCDGCDNFTIHRWLPNGRTRDVPRFLGLKNAGKRILVDGLDPIQIMVNYDLYILYISTPCSPQPMSTM